MPSHLGVLAPQQQSGSIMNRSHHPNSSPLRAMLAVIAFFGLLAPLVALRGLGGQAALGPLPQLAGVHRLVRPAATTTSPPAPAPLDRSSGAPATVVAAPAAAMPPGDSVRDARLLVLAADGAEPALRAITQTLDYLGTPYTVWIPAQHPGGLTGDQLFSGKHSFYQGVMLTSDSLSVTPDGGATWDSTLTDAEWETLWRYEAVFGLRQVIWHTVPNDIFGFGSPTAVDTTSTPITATLTTAGQSVFFYLNPHASITIRDAYTYLAPLTNRNATPLLVDANGNALAAVRVFPDGRQNLMLTFDNDPALVHTLVLAYGVINWVTQGLFLGERHIALSAQVDDIFIPNNIWLPGTPCGTVLGLRPSGVTYRMSGDDLRAAVAWQERVRARVTTGNLRLHMAFNGLGATNGDPSDTLIAATRQMQDSFAWISHTYSHFKLDTVDYPTAADEIMRNNLVAGQLGPSLYNPASLVTPEVSGLSNPQFLQAAYDQGIRYLVSDTSQEGQSNPSPNTGRYNRYQPAILEIPRRPTNLGYDVSLPAEWVAEYNCLNRSMWGRDLTYAEILDTESDYMLQYLLRGDLDPWMFHQANLRAYDGTHSLLSDLLDHTLAKYDRLFNLPITSPTMDGVGTQIANRMRYDVAGVTASIASSGITLTAQRDAVVPITGLRIGDAEYYGTQDIAHIKLKAGQSVTLPIPWEPPWPPKYTK